MKKAAEKKTEADQQKSAISEIKVRLTLREELLGTSSANPEIHETFIAAKAPDAITREEEVAAIGAEPVIENAMTIFPKDDGQPFMWDYQIKGFFKDACGMLRRVPGTKSSKLTNYKKVIDGLVFVKERRIPLVMPDGTGIGSCQRPLRAQTAQGERIALANSETVAAGTTLDFTVVVYNIAKNDLAGCVMEWLEYGMLRGLGQWRNSGKGSFSFVKVD